MCPSNYVQVGKMCFLDFGAEMTYKDAKQTCEDLGASLPYFHSANDYISFRNWLYAYLAMIFVINK